MSPEKRILDKKILEWHRAGELEERNLKNPIVLKNDVGEIRLSDIKQMQKTIFQRPKYGSRCKLPGLGHA